MKSVREYYDTFWVKSPTRPGHRRRRGILKFTYPHAKRSYDSDIIKWCHEVMGKENVMWFWDHYHFTNERDLTLFLMRWP